MITQINNVPNNMVAFRASGEVTKDDFEIVKKQVSSLVDQTGKLNYLMYLENSPKDFTVGAWLQDAMVGLENLGKWHRAAIISDSDTVKKFTDVFSKVMPGEFRGFPENEYDHAVNWVSERTDV